MVSEVVSTAHCAWIVARYAVLLVRESPVSSFSKLRGICCWRLVAVLCFSLWLQFAAVETTSELEVCKDSMAELKMGELGASKYGEAIYIAGSVLHPSIWLGPC